jgi:anti-sigma28 factor (negative regulator of flagellin synthesis)
MRLQLDPSLNPTGGIDRTPSSVSSGSDAQGAAVNDSDARDSSYISGTSSLLNRASEDRAARIQQLTDLVQNGGYQTSSASISHSLVANSLS